LFTYSGVVGSSIKYKKITKSKNDFSLTQVPRCLVWIRVRFQVLRCWIRVLKIYQGWLHLYLDTDCTSADVSHYLYTSDALLFNLVYHSLHRMQW